MGEGSEESVKKFDVVVAADRAWGIGRDGAMPWPRLRGDLQHFRRITSTATEGRWNAVIMGRKTWDSLGGKPLGGRRNLVVSRGAPIVPEGVGVAGSLDEALAAAADAETTFVIGGAEIYRIALEHLALRWIYLTRVDATYEADARVPDLDAGTFAIDAAWDGAEVREDAGVRYRFERLSAGKGPHQASLPGLGPPAPPSIIEAPTPEQTAIVDEIRSGTRHVLVEALAGTGKTSTILKSIERSTVRRVLLCAFGRANAAALRAKMPKAPSRCTRKASTLHSQGLAILHSYGWQPAVDDKEGGIHGDESENLVNDVADAIAKAVSAEELHGHALWFSHLPTAAVGNVKYMISNEVRRAARDLLIYWKDRCLGQEDVAAEDLEAFDDLSSEEDVDLVHTIAHYAYLGGARVDRPKIDQHDMIWLPLFLDLAPKWTYDLVIVDEGQDLSRPQFQLAIRLMAPGAKLVVVGDLRQSVYGWRGAVGDEVWAEMKAMGAVTLPLTVSFRCAHAVIELANVLVPDLRGWDRSPVGAIHTCTLARMIEGLPTTTIDSFVLSRNNAVLFDIALKLWSRGAIFSFSKGKELAVGLHALVNRLNTNDAESFRKSLDEWYEQALAKAEEKSAIGKIARIKQRRSTLLSLLTCTEPKGLHALLQRLTTERDRAVVKLATVHGAKGLEADRVYLMRETFARHQEKPPDPIPPEELNLEYVAITRARRELVWVDSEAR